MLTAVKNSFFSAHKILDFLILNWSGRLIQTEELIDSSLSKKIMQNVEKLLSKTDKLLCCTLMIKAMIDHLKKLNIERLNQYGTRAKLISAVWSTLSFF